MSRLINRPVAVAAGPDGAPCSFVYCGGLLQVSQVLDHWLETGRWWEGEQERETYRVATSAGGIYELTREVPDGGWVLYKAYD